MKIVEVNIPEYTLETLPDYSAVGTKIDKVVSENFEGKFLVRALSMVDHPQYTLDELVDIIVKSGTDKYDPGRKGVAHEEFEPYKPDLQAGEVVVENGKLVSEPFSEDVRRFYENTLLDRGYRLRIDLLVFYDPDQMVRAEKVDMDKPSVAPQLEEYLWKFRDSMNKQKALIGIVKILK